MKMKKLLAVFLAVSVFASVLPCEGWASETVPDATTVIAQEVEAETTGVEEGDTEGEAGAEANVENNAETDSETEADESELSVSDNDTDENASEITNTIDSSSNTLETEESLSVEEPNIETYLAELQTDTASYKLTEKQLFMQAPLYLENEITDNYITACWNRAQSAMNDISTSDTYVAAYIEGLKSGIHYITKHIANEIGLTGSNYDDFNKKMAKELLREYFSVENSVSENLDEIGENFSYIKDTYDLSDSLGRIQYAEEVASKMRYVKNPEVIEGVVNQAYDKLSNNKKVLGYIDDGIDISVFITEMLAMQDVELAAVDDLIAIQDVDSDLYKGLVAVRDELNQNMAERFVKVYCTDKVIKEIGDFCKDHSIEGLAGLFDISSFAVLGAKLVTSGVVFVYEITGNITVDDIVYATIMQNYTQISNRGYEQLKKKFRTNTATEGDIETLKNAYDFHLACLKLWMDKAKKCTKDKVKINSLDNWSNGLGTSLNSEVYVNKCLEKATEAINNGTLTITADSSTYKTSDGTVIDENYDSTESIAARFAVIQSQYMPNTGITWTGSWGGAIQCFGFARMVFSKLFGCEMPSAYVGSARYKYATENNVDLVGQLVGGNVTNTNVKNMLSSGKLGDIIQAYGNKYGQHTMVFVNATADGVTVYDCNANLSGQDPACSIHQYTINWNTWVSYYGTGDGNSENGISLYRASNYASIYGNGDGLFYDDSVNFVINADGVLTKYNGWQSFVVIPDTVTAIGDSAFKNNKTMMSVEIPDSVKSIGNSAFYGCTSLVGVIIPDSVEKIGDSAFNNCISMRSAYLPENDAFTIIASKLFGNCKKLRNIVLPDSIVEIGNNSFYGCTDLLNVSLPKFIESIGYGAFRDCNKITYIVIPKTLKNVAYYDEWLTIGGLAGMQHNHYGVFTGCTNLEQVEFEEGTECIPANIMADCEGIRKIEMPDSVVQIEERAFYNCVNLSDLKLSDGIIQIEYDAFSNCSSLKEIRLPNDLRILLARAFENCDNVRSVYIPKKIKISAGAFRGCNLLKQVEFEEGIKIIPDYMFDDCAGLEELQIPNSVIKIGECAFYDCTNLKKVNLPVDLIHIGRLAFRNCESLEDIEIPSNIRVIEERAFEGCTKISKILLPDSIEQIGESVFAACVNLEEIVLPNEMKEVPEGMCSGCVLLKDVKFPKTLTNIGEYAFSNCDSLTQIVIPNSVTSIGKSAFYHCDKLDDVQLGIGVEKITNYCFAGCVSLKKIILPYKVNKIGEGAFEDDIALQEIVIPRMTATISDSAFSNKSDITIHGCLGTYAEVFATENNMAFVADEVRATNIEFDTPKVVIGKWREKQLGLLVEPRNFTSEIVWTSSDNEVATVDKDGVISAKYNEGKTIISAEIDGLIKTCEVTVGETLDNIYIDKSDEFDEGVLVLEEGESWEFCSKEEPQNAFNKELKWSSSQPHIAIVDDTGKVTALMPGRTTILVDPCDGSSWEKSFGVSVIPKPTVVTEKENLQSSHPYISEDDQVWMYSIPNADQINVTFSEQTDVLEECDYIYIYDGKNQLVGQYTGTQLAGKTVSAKGADIKIRLTGEGCYSCYGCYQCYGFSVTNVWAGDLGNGDDINTPNPDAPKPGTPKPDAPSGGTNTGTNPGQNTNTQVTPQTINVASITLDGISKKIAVGKKLALTAAVAPENASNTSVTWTSSNEKYATVSATGVVSTKKAGAGKNVTITATANDGSGVTASYTIKIMKDAVKKVKIKASTKTVTAGKKIKLKAQITTTGKKVNKTLIWTSSNEEYATVNSKGQVKTTKAGKGKTVTITAKATDGSGKSAKIKLKIK